MIPSPIRKVLSTFQKHRVRALLMGGQACILYGAAEFSRDTDFAVLCDPQNLQRLRDALRELRASPVFVPPLDERYLKRGHACHFRCHAGGVERLRVDVMSVMRGCDSFPKLWRRRRTMRIPKLGTINVLSLPDLVRAKKTQRDKDWPMIRRLMEADYFAKRRRHRAPDVVFWLRELRTPELLITLARQHRRAANRLRNARPLLELALRGDTVELTTGLAQEEHAERSADRAYWLPLRKELAELRQTGRSS